MRLFKKSLVVISILLLFTPSVHALEKNYATEGEDIAAYDYVGIYMEVPEKVQRIIGMKIAKAEKSEFKEKIYINGRVPQDVEDITDVYAPGRGVIAECASSLGTFVEKGHVLCVVEIANNGEAVKVIAPTSGIVIAEFSKLGESVDTISPIHTIADYSKLPVNFDVYEKDIGKIRPDQRVLVYSSAYPDKTFEGRVTFISPRIDETSFTLKIRVLVGNPEYLLKPGMFVRGEIVIKTNKDHVAVPSNSVQNLDGIDVVFIQEEKESFIPTKVGVAHIDRGRTIISGHIKVGDFVVVDGAYNLKSKILESEIVGGCAHGH